MHPCTSVRYLLLAFEGPDLYSRIGGLATRVNGLAPALAGLGCETDLVFVGDPEAAPEETWHGVRLHRVLQDISARYPRDAYHGEEEKVAALTDRFPGWVIERVLYPARSRDEHVVVIAEDWQTAPALIALSDAAWQAGLRETLTLVWNANNPFGFDRIDWPRLNFIANLTTVSRWMKHVMWELGVNPVVIPNGLPDDAFQVTAASRVSALRSALGDGPIWVKVGRFDIDKRWEMAIRALDGARHGSPTRLLIRGGREPYRETLRDLARRLDLSWDRVPYDATWPQPLAGTQSAIVEIENFLPSEEVRVLYQAADAVLANSGREPFGLVGLEVMAASGLGVIGTTGEDYGRAYINAIVVETDDPLEVVHHLSAVQNSDRADFIRAEGRRTAERYRWTAILPLFTSFMAYFRRQNR